MNANDVIESYVTDVAERLPRKQRNDVAFELRELLNEGLQGRAEEAGRAADEAMATEYLREFGRPADVAARYRPALTVIDPADGPAFVRAAVIGLGVIWGLGLWIHLRQPGDFLTALGQWWVSTVIPSLWWPGVLVAGFGLSSWARRRWPHTAEWKPRAADRVPGTRAGLALGIVGILCGILALVDPRWVLDVLFGGRAAPAAYDALTYTETFRHRQAPWLLVLMALNVPLFITVLVSGRRSATMRRIETGLGLVTSAVLVWTVLDGPVFMAPAGDRAVKFFLVLIIVFTLISLGIKLRRSVRPAPNQQLQAQKVE